MQQTSELLAIAGEIAQDYPPVPDRTGLLLYDVDPGHLQAQWQVAPADFARALGAFPVGAVGVRPVLRLLRLDADGQARLVESIPEAAGPGVAGSAYFTPDAPGASFVSELGIESADGGWLLLARSNRVRLPPLGLVDPTLAALEAPLEPIFPLPGREPEGDLPGGVPPYLALAAPAGETTGSPPMDAPTAESPAPVAPGAPAVGIESPPIPSTRLGLAVAGPLALTFYEPRAAISSHALQRSAYPPPDIEIHAELLVYGRAAPGSLVDILGHRVHAGPDGGFSVRHLLDDSLALSRAPANSPAAPPAGPDTK